MRQLELVFGVKRPEPAEETTPGTRVSWSTLHEWIEAWHEISGRKISAMRYRQEEAHVAALLARQDLVDGERWIGTLERLLAVMRDLKRPRGQREKHPATIIIERSNNRITALKNRGEKDIKAVVALINSLPDRSIWCDVHQEYFPRVRDQRRAHLRAELKRAVRKAARGFHFELPPLEPGDHEEANLIQDVIEMMEAA